MSLTKLTSVTSAVKEIDKAKITGELELSVVGLYNMYQYYLDFTEDKEIFEEENVSLWDRIDSLKHKYTAQLCNYKATLPSSINSFTEEDIITDGSGGIVGGLTPPVVTAFTASTFSNDTLFGTGDTYSTHTFTTAEFEAVYSDHDGDTQFQYLIIERTALDSLKLKYLATATTGQVYAEAAAPPIQIAYADVGKWSLYTDSLAVYSHDINFRLVDVIGSTTLESNTAIMTLDRTSVGNQPATIGDIALKVNNRLTTFITVAMVTSSLTPPYNDPEGDLIDAIRIDEISTANLGVFNYNGSPVSTGQVISKAELEANLFEHVGPNVNTIETDAINFSVRDAGSLIWVQ